MAKSETYPDDELDVGLGGPAAEELESTGDIHCTDLVKVIGLGGVARRQEFEDTVQAILLDRLDLDALEQLGW